MLKLRYIVLIFFTICLFSACEPQPKQCNQAFTVSMPSPPSRYIANSYAGTTYECVKDPYSNGRIYRFETNYPYGDNTYWYGMTC